MIFRGYIEYANKRASVEAFMWQAFYRLACGEPRTRKIMLTAMALLYLF